VFYRSKEPLSQKEKGIKIEKNNGHVSEGSRAQFSKK
jgi:hypothetical protein